MKISAQALISLCSSQGNQGLTLQEMLHLLGQPKSKKTRLRKVLRDMAKLRLMTKKNARYFLLSEGTQSKKRQKEKIGGRFAGNSKTPVQGILIPGETPTVFIPATGNTYPVQPSDELWNHTLPWDQIQLKPVRNNNGENVLRAGSTVTRHVGVFDGLYTPALRSFVPFGFPYLDIAVHLKNRLTQPTPGTIKLVANRHKGGRAGGPEFRAMVPPDEARRKQIINRLFRRLQVPGDFLPNVRQEVEPLPSTVRVNPKSKRRDLRLLPFITIDGATAKDFDDAVYAEKNSNGYTLYVAVADVAEYVVPKSATDQSALERGNSYYLVDHVSPMLPEKLSNDLCSLKPEVNRNVLVCELYLNAAGEPLQTKLYEAVIRSFARMTYEECDEGLKTGKWRSPKITDKVAPLLHLYRELFLILREKRRQRGMVEFSFPEFHFELDAAGSVIGVRKYLQTESMGIIEQFMLEANEAVAAFAGKHAISLMWRNHPKTDAKKISAVGSILQAAGINTKRIQTQSGLNETLLSLRDAGDRDDLEIILLRCMSKAVYEVKSKGHFGLAAPSYCHFTSPIRRYADLFNHRNIKQFLHGKPLFTASPEVARDITECEVNAGAAETKVKKLYSLFYSAGSIGQTYRGRVSAANRRGVIVKVGEEETEGWLFEKQLSRLGFRFDPRLGTYQCGSRKIGPGSRITCILGSIIWEDLTLMLLPVFDRE